MCTSDYYHERRRSGKAADKALSGDQPGGERRVSPCRCPLVRRVAVVLIKRHACPKMASAFGAKRVFLPEVEARRAVRARAARATPREAKDACFGKRFFAGPAGPGMYRRVPAPGSAVPPCAWRCCSLRLAVLPKEKRSSCAFIPKWDAKTDAKLFCLQAQ